MKHLFAGAAIYAALCLAAAIKLAIIFRPRRYSVRLRERSKWGDLFDVVGPNGETVGFDRWKPVNERCAALNHEAKNAGKRQSAA
jgi:hypothetical protein